MTREHRSFLPSWISRRKSRGSASPSIQSNRWRRLNPRRGVGRRVASLAAMTLAASGCLYGFAGGGLPPHIHTVAILPFDNQTSQPALTQAVADALREAVESRLGLRPASEASADAVVR